jgi:hypothetical protein
MGRQTLVRIAVTAGALVLLAALVLWGLDATDPFRGPIQ